MGFDRALTKAALDVGLDVVAAGGTKSDLAERLEPVVGAKEAAGRTRAHVARTWLEPPAHARGFVAWGVEHRAVDPGHTILHHLALLATTPFLVPVAVLAGRQLKAGGGRIDSARLTTSLGRSLGTDRAATQGIANALATFRDIGLLMGTDEVPLSTQLQVPKELAGWATHGLLVIRRSWHVDVEEWRHAEEYGLLGRKPTGGVMGYPLLTLQGHRGRTVASEKD